MLNEKISPEIKEILDFSNLKEAKNYYYLKNSDGKIWLIPAESSRKIKTALGIYQPSNIKGKLFKAFYPYLANKAIVNKKMGIELIKIKFKTEFLSFIKEIYETDELDFTFFQGTPSVHRKSTIQVSDQNLNILGYIKLSKDIEVKKLIINESIFLDKLSKFKLNTPRLLSYKNFFLSEVTIMIQSTKKNSKTKTSNTLQKEHFEFERNLYENSKQKIDYIKTKYFINQNKYIEILKSVRNIELKEHIIRLKNKIDKLYIGIKIECGISNRDFTPWNMCFTDKELFVFDWEYASDEYPRFYDLFHFFTQNAFLVRNLSEKKVCIGIKKLMKILEKKYPEYKREELKNFYLIYLLDITLFYLSRNPQEINLKWLDLIKEIEKGGLD